MLLRGEAPLFNLLDKFAPPSGYDTIILLIQ